MTVKQIVTQWLKENDYDGLVNLDQECGCRAIDMCLMECGCENCEPAYWHSCDKCESQSDCEWFELNAVNAGCYKLNKQEGK